MIENNFKFQINKLLIYLLLHKNEKVKLKIIAAINI